MKENKIESKLYKKAAGRHLRRAVGALLCVFLTGCIIGCTGCNENKALTVELGEPVTETGSEATGSTWWEDCESVSRGDCNLTATSKPRPLLYVYVCGAVKMPGVVTLPEGSRCNDALEAAGGFAEDAAREYVNLAKLVSDGEQLYFPTVEECNTIASMEESQTSGLVNINTAGVEQLCTLPGIGETKAGAIVAYREQEGSFATVEEIMLVPGIKESAYSQIKDLITVK